MVNSWTSSQVIEFYGILKNSQSKEKLWDVAPLESYSILEFRDILNTYGSGKYSESIGKKFAVDMGDTYGIHNFILIGMNADTLASGGNAFMTFQSEDIVAKQRFDFDNGPSYSESPICDFVEGLIDYFPMSLQTEIKSVVKYEGEGQGEHSFNSKIWIMSLDAFAESSSINHADDPVYDYWSDKSLNTTMKPVENYGKTINIDTRKMFNNTPYSWILRNPSGTFGSNVYRDVFDEYGIRSYLYRYADTTETWFNTQVFGDSSNLGLVKPENLPPSGYVPGGHGIDLGDTAGIVPCFCI